ncbi:unnamed protein product [Plutella xylostella]|uniref:(diamondback moth) hypothetical protein n=1 Tax=Plutella xylostella TaxID=51655 RepID=A0A8S4G262_PLUXY|nr:unnamed protein product [Plutella xylostella]
MRIPFFRKPPLSNKYNLNTTPVSPEMTEQINLMIHDKILEPADSSASFVSPMFLVPKSDGSQRPILNLKNLNNYIQPMKFRLISHYNVPNFLQPGDWVAKVDLSRAYFHVSISRSHRRFLRVIYQDVTYQMTALPFGLSCAPKIFASLTNWVAETIRHRGIRIIVYLDDYFVACQSKEVLQSHIHQTLHLLKFLGWNINFQKSITTPGRKLEFLGILWDLEQNLKSIPIKKQDRILHLLQSYRQKKVWCLKQAQILLGCLNFACFVIPLGRLHCRLIQIHCRDLRRSPKSKMTIPQEVLQELEWWELAVRKATPIHNPPITDFLVTDAASYGWGAILNNTTMAGVWDHHQTSWHSNRKELHAIYKALTQRKIHLKNRSLLIQSDNRTALSYLKNQGGTRSVALLQEARDILHLASVYNIHLVPQYLPGSLNGSADRLSRNRPLPEWHLLRCATQPVFRVFGHPQIDLFASKNAHVVNRYCTMDFLDQQAEFCNAFTQEWNYRLGWLFPPPYLVPKILIHLNKCQGQYILITPRWERTFWMPDLKSRVLQGPIQIEKLKETLVDTATMRPPPKIDSIILEAWLVQAGKIS